MRILEQSLRNGSPNLRKHVDFPRRSQMQTTQTFESAQNSAEESLSHFLQQIFSAFFVEVALL